MSNVKEGATNPGSNPAGVAGASKQEDSGKSPVTGQMSSDLCQGSFKGPRFEAQELPTLPHLLTEEERAAFCEGADGACCNCRARSQCQERPEGCGGGCDECTGVKLADSAQGCATCGGDCKGCDADNCAARGAGCVRCVSCVEDAVDVQVVADCTAVDAGKPGPECEVTAELPVIAEPRYCPGVPPYNDCGALLGTDVTAERCAHCEGLMAEIRAQEDSVSEVVREPAQEVDELARMSGSAAVAMQDHLAWVRVVLNLSQAQVDHVGDVASDVVAALFDGLSEVHTVLEASAIASAVAAGVGEILKAQIALAMRKGELPLPMALAQAVRS